MVEKLYYYSAKCHTCWHEVNRNKRFCSGCLCDPHGSTWIGIDKHGNLLKGSASKYDFVATNHV